MTDIVSWPEAKFGGLKRARTDDERADLIRKLLETPPAPERLHLECKQVSTKSQVPDENDYNAFSKQTCGFANSAGGLLVWGVEWKDFQDSQPQLLGVPDCRAFAQSLDAKGKEATERPADFQNLPIPMQDLDQRDGLVVTFVPESEYAPHRAKWGKRQGVKDHYWRRYADSTRIMTHAELEDAFGTRQRPALRPRVTMESSGSRLFTSWDIWNVGRGTAFAVTLEVRVRHVLLESGTVIQPGSKLALRAQQKDTRAAMPDSACEPNYGRADNYIPLNSRPIRSEDGHCTMMLVSVSLEDVAAAAVAERTSRKETVLRFDWVLGAHNMRTRRAAYLLPTTGNVVAVLCGACMRSRPLECGPGEKRTVTATEFR